MPDSTTYRVVLALETTGSLGAKVGEITEKIGRAHLAATGFQRTAMTMGETAARSFERVGHLVESVADKIMHVVEVGAAIGAAGLFGAAAYGVTHLNEELERTQISLGAIFQAQGFASDFTSAFSMAGDQLTKMKRDVKTLPGDLGQLSDIMKMIATPAAQGGLGADAIRKLAGQTMLVGTILGVQQDVAAREMANLLAGRAGAHNILGGRLGLIGEQARTFNAESPTKRVEEIQQLLSRYQGANDRFAQSFIANWTTLKDNIKYGFLADATSPLFESVKRTIASINTWFDNNQDKVKSWAMAFGQRLSTTWDGLVSAAASFGPALDNLGHRFFELWDAAIEKAHELEPILAKVASFLEHVSAADITGGAKDLLYARLGGMALQPAAQLAGKAIAGGTGGLAGVGGAAYVGGAIGDAAIVAAGAKMSIDEFTQTVKDGGDKAKIVADAHEKATVAIEHLSGVMDQNTAQGLMLQSALDALFIKVDKLRPDEPPPPIKEHELDPLSSHMLLASSALQKISETAKKLPGGGGGTNIQKVEVNVKGSDDPSRVARLVVSELQKVARNPTRSANVPDYSAMR